MFARILRLVPLAALLCACGPAEGAQDEPGVVRSRLEGRVTVNPAVDSVARYDGFEVLVARSEGAGLDTLGFAVTDSTGAFALDVAAPARGVYPLAVGRRGTLLLVDEVAVADGDTARFEVVLPTNRPVRFRGSRENAAWAAYKNAVALYNQNFTRLAQEGALTDAALRQTAGQTATILWSMRENYGGTLGAELAAARAVELIAGVDDSLLVVYARQVEPDNPRFADVGRAARRAETRRGGFEAGHALLDDFIARAADDEDRAALTSERVLAHLNQNDVEAASEAARGLAADYPESGWATWAGNALYDFEHLLPGMPAPTFSASTNAGGVVTLDSLRGRHVVLEFYNPLDPAYEQELPGRNALYDLAGDAPFEIVSVSLLGDRELNRAFVESRGVPGVHVTAGAGFDSELAQEYNVNLLPRRFLIAPDGTILSKYEGASVRPLQLELAALVSESGDDAGE